MKKVGPKADPRKGGGSEERGAKKAWSRGGPRTAEKGHRVGGEWGEGEREVILTKRKNEREGTGSAE